MIASFHGKKYYIELRNNSERLFVLHELSCCNNLKDLEYDIIEMRDSNDKMIHALVFDEPIESFRNEKHIEWERLKAHLYSFRRNG